MDSWKKTLSKEIINMYLEMRKPKEWTVADVPVKKEYPRKNEEWTRNEEAFILLAHRIGLRARALSRLNERTPDSIIQRIINPKYYKYNARTDNFKELSKS